MTLANNASTDSKNNIDSCEIEKMLQPIDLSLSGSDEKIIRSARESGFIVLKNHGIDLKLIHGALDAFHDFYHLSDEIKESYIGADGLGFFKLESENASGSTVKNYMEYYHWNKLPCIKVPIPLDIEAFDAMSLDELRTTLSQEIKVDLSDFTKEQIISGAHNDNLYAPIALPIEDLKSQINSSFSRSDMIDLFDAFCDLEKKLLDILEDGLTQDKRGSVILEEIKRNNEHITKDGRCLRHALGGVHTINRVIHYPKVPDQKRGAPGAKAHTDLNLLTLLGGATTKGLQILPLGAKEWISVPTDKDWLVVNIGDTLEFATGRFYPSTTHRVIRDDSLGNECRLSMPFFGNAISNFVLSRSFGPTIKGKESQVTADDLQRKRLYDIGEQTTVTENQKKWDLEMKRQNIASLTDQLLKI